MGADRVTLKAQKDLDKFSDFKYSNRRLKMTPQAFSNKQVIVPSSEVYFRLDCDEERGNSVNLKLRQVARSVGPQAFRQRSHSEMNRHANMATFAQICNS